MRRARAPARSTLATLILLSSMFTSRNGKKRRSRLRKSHSRPGKQLPIPDSSRVETGLPATIRGACLACVLRRNAATLRGTSFTFGRSCSSGQLLGAHAALGKVFGALIESDRNRRARQNSSQPRMKSQDDCVPGSLLLMAAARAKITRPADTAVCLRIDVAFRREMSRRFSRLSPWLSRVRNRPLRPHGGRRTSVLPPIPRNSHHRHRRVWRTRPAMQLLQRNRKIAEAQSHARSKRRRFPNVQGAAAHRDSVASRPM